ncbi:hypothetical protein JW766_00850 [Candidatus Dojkabacteria bacterium]|nr:hypothetical protein [Candidatus Dojkabacteria bacterium]
MKRKLFKRILGSCKGITLTETIVYIGLLSIIAVGVISIAMQLVQLRTNASSLSLISSETTKLLDRIVFEVRDCDDFTVIDDTTLEITKDGSITEYYLQDGKIYADEDGDVYQVSSNLVNISQVKYSDWTSINSDNLVHIEVEISRGNLHEQFQVSAHKR